MNRGQVEIVHDGYVIVVYAHPDHVDVDDTVVDWVEHEGHLVSSFVDLDLEVVVDILQDDGYEVVFADLDDEG